MKKLVFFAAFAAALMSLSCSKETRNDFSSNKLTVQFNAIETGTKTVFGTPDGTKYPTLWTDAKIQAGISLNLSSTDKVAADVTPSADGKTASFKAVFENPATAESYTFVSFYPNSSVKSVNATNRTLNIEFPASQTSTAATPDENAQIIYAVSKTYDAFPNEDVALAFKHAPAYLHLVFENAALGTAQVSGVNITSNAKISGRWFVNVEDGSVSENGTAGGYTIGVATTTLSSVWCALVPVDLSSKTLKFVITTDKGTLTKEVTLPADRLLTPGSIKKLAVDMTGVVLQEPVVYKLVKSKDELNFGDQVIIVSDDTADGKLERALGATQNSNNRAAANIVKEGDYINNPSESVQILSLEEGAIPGTFSFKTSAGYLYAPGGGNYLRTQEAKDNAASFDITISTEGTKIIGQKSGITQVEMRYNNNTNSDGSVNNLFSCYASSSSCKPVVLYRKDVDPIDAEQYFTATLPGVTSLSASAHTEKVYVFGNVAWTASVTGGSSLDVTSGSSSAILTLTIPENTTSSQISHVVTISTTASVSPKSYELTITQAAASSGPGIPAGTILWSEDWEGGAKDETPAAYNAKDAATTVVYNGGKVVYTYTDGGSKTKLYDDYIVYVDKEYTGTKPDGKKMNLLLGKKSSSKNGTWTITGIPCKDVSKAKITFRANYGTAGYTNLSTTTAGVTIGAFTVSNYTSDWNKTVYVAVQEITFSGTAETFDLKFSNTNSSNNLRLDDIEVEVVE